MIVRFIFALCFAATGAVGADRAIVVGIDDYSGVSGAPDLNGAVADANRVAERLVSDLGFTSTEVTVLTNAEAKYEAILSTIIDRLVGETRPGDRAFLYFAGHGTVSLAGSPSLVAHDGDAVLGQIPLSTLGEIFDLIADRDATIVLDAGFDGGPIGVRGIAGDIVPEEITLSDSVNLWTASTGSQFAWEELDRGVFTTGWLDAMAAGRESHGDVLGHVGQALGSWCDETSACMAAGRGLAPRFSGDQNAVFQRLEAVSLPPRPIEPPAKPAPDSVQSFEKTVGVVVDLFGPSNDAELELSIAGGSALRLGQTITMEARARRPGSLLLLDVDPTGALAQVYPSRLSQAGATTISAAAPLVIPSAIGANGRPLALRVTEPTGRGLLLALLIEGDLADIEALLPAGLAGGTVPEASQSLFEVSQALLRLAADPENPVRWSATYLPYQISP
ncbi:MAG: caspase family protein [Pseudomonadota bacterium]